MASIHGTVGQGHSAVSQHSGICAPAPEEQGIQCTIGDEVDGRLLGVFEHVLQDPGDTASQLGVFLLSGQVEDDP